MGHEPRHAASAARVDLDHAVHRGGVGDRRAVAEPAARLRRPAVTWPRRPPRRRGLRRQRGHRQLGPAHVRGLGLRRRRRRCHRPGHRSARPPPPGPVPRPRHHRIRDHPDVVRLAVGGVHPRLRRRPPAPAPLGRFRPAQPVGVPGDDAPRAAGRLARRHQRHADEVGPGLPDDPRGRSGSSVLRDRRHPLQAARLHPLRRHRRPGRCALRRRHRARQQRRLPAAAVAAHRPDRHHRRDRPALGRRSCSGAAGAQPQAARVLPGL